MADDGTQPQPSTPRLDLAWLDVPDDSVARSRHFHGETLGALNALADLREDLRSLPEEADIPGLFRHLEYLLDGYFSRIYELRERSWELVVALARLPAHKHREKGYSPDLRDRVRMSHPKELRAYDRLWNLIREDVETRNAKTHRQYFQLRLIADDGDYNPLDAMGDVQDPAERHMFGMKLRELCDEFGERFASRLDRIIDETGRFLDDIVLAPW